MAGSERRHVERERGPALRRRQPMTGVGLGVDADGRPVVDPTENVRELFEAGATRQDDLRLAERRLQEEKILRVETEMRMLRHEVKLRASHQQDLDALEAKRLDAVRSQDQLAAKTEADRQGNAVTALAASAATTAETLRSAVNTSAQNLATQLTNTVNAITERIAALEKSSYTGQGKQAVADPMMEQLVNEMRNLTAQRAADAGAQSGRHGTQENLKSVLQVGIAAILLMIALATFFLKSSPATAPQVIYVPAPSGTVQPSTAPAMTRP